MREEDNRSTAELYAQYVAPTYGRFALFPQKGKGVHLWDEEGKRFLDFGGGVAVNSLGHAHPAMLEAIQKQAGELIHCSNLYQQRGQAELARLLVEKVVEVPGKCFFCNSGAEANEGLIKLARRFGELSPSASGESRREILCFDGSFHGRTTGGMAATGQEKIRSGFGPLMGGFKHLPFNDITALESSVSEQTVAILLEPIQGEGGIHVASAEFLSAAKEICQERDMLLFFDEVQCGIGRCGELGGWRAVKGAEEIVPDGISWAKGLGGGFPVGAIWINNRSVGDASLCDALGPGSHGSTFGGSPLASAVSGIVIRTILEENICENVARIGEGFMKEVQVKGIPLITEVRGLGLMIGFQIDTDAVSGVESFKGSGKSPSLFLVELLAEAGLLTVPARTDVIRWLPPLVVTEEDVIEALEIMRKTLKSLAG